MSSLSGSSSEGSKACRLCHKMLPIGCYHANPSSRDGHRNICKECRQEHRRDVKRHKCICRPSNLYIMCLSTDPGGLIHGLKIGRSCNIEERARDLAASLPFDMVVLATIPSAGHLEMAVHSHLATRRNTDSNAREWFRISLTEALIAIAVMLPA